ncbi:head decoration protein [Azospirillum rugosum]|uniref:Bacteriophage lambda head decoration protein D n=1 Tax=Azospirillum rugosum TaxID=416170 RepID=A0ABS4SEP0_9PROT|nr:head decoration protein [Azospirillum rugosum]MBP2291039.1 hypothetical protein [Azospirillum rugosum]MDQ0524897.1 hypothetical protein [Azospirillum rugosum]
MPDIIIEGARPGEFLVSEANGYRSREQVMLASGGVYGPGTVLGQITHGTATAAPKAGNAGNGTVGSITVGSGVQPGVYVVTFLEPATNAGAFQVEDPDGENIGTGAVGAAFSGGGLGFTIADGSNDFGAGDQFKITVAAGSLHYKPWNPANTDGSETAIAVLYREVDATAGAKRGLIIARDAEVNANYLAWFTGATANQIAMGVAQLAERRGANGGIIVR